MDIDVVSTERLLFNCVTETADLIRAFFKDEIHTASRVITARHEELRVKVLTTIEVVAFPVTKPPHEFHKRPVDPA